MNIKPIIYNDLSHEERISATLSALNRKDKNEIQRLIKSCELKSYTQPHSDYIFGLLERIIICQDIKLDEKQEYLKIIKEFMRENTEDSLRIETVFVHKRHATWPPKDIDPKHLVSDEFIDK